MTLGEHTYLVILAGGEGKRFAPLSTPECPKQFLRLFDQRSLLQTTVERFAPLVPQQRMRVATNVRYQSLVRKHLPWLSAEQMYAEPCTKNTAPALGWAAKSLWEHNPDATMIVVPADQMIRDAAALCDALSRAVSMAMSGDWLVTLSVLPDRPATEYGYIEPGIPCAEGVYRVARFIEKPDATRAAQYLASGVLQWNSGMFVWRATTLLHDIERHLPELHDAITRHLRPGAHDVASYFAAAPTISIDYGVMERSTQVATIPVACGWSDVGSWEGLRRLVEQHGVPLNPEVQPFLERYA